VVGSRNNALRYSFIERARYIGSYGARLGALSGLVCSSAYALLIVLFLIFLSIAATINSSSVDQDPFDSFGIIFLVVIYAIAIGIIPFTLIGLFGGWLFGCLISSFPQKLPIIVLVAIGVILAALVLAVPNYLFWLFSSEYGRIFGLKITPFLAEKFWDHFQFFGTPSIIAFIVSGWLAWKIGKYSQTFHESN